MLPEERVVSKNRIYNLFAEKEKRMDRDNIYGHISQILITEEEIREKVREAGRMITEEYRDRPLLLVSILNGAFMFMADICRQVKTPCEIAFMSVKSYQGDSTTGNVQIVQDIKRDISGYHVVIIEDIMDTGLTLRAVTDILRCRNPLSLKIVTLLDKPERRIADIRPDYALFTIPNLFVIGYGLDYNEAYRELPYIAEYSA